MSAQDSYQKYPLGPSKRTLKERRVGPGWRPPLATWTLPNRPLNLVVEEVPCHMRTPTGNLGFAHSALQPCVEGVPCHVETPTDHLDFANLALQLLIEGVPSRRKTPTGNMDFDDSALQPCGWRSAQSREDSHWQFEPCRLGPSTFRRSAQSQNDFFWQSKLYSWPFNF